MDIITAAKVYEEELRKEEFECIQNIIESYKNPYKPESMNLTGEIFKPGFGHKNYFYQLKQNKLVRPWRKAVLSQGLAEMRRCGDQS